MKHSYNNITISNNKRNHNNIATHLNHAMIALVLKQYCFLAISIANQNQKSIKDNTKVKMKQY